MTRLYSLLQSQLGLLHSLDRSLCRHLSSDAIMPMNDSDRARQQEVARKAVDVLEEMAFLLVRHPPGSLPPRLPF